MNDLRSKSWALTLPVAAMAAAYVWFFLPGKHTVANLRAEIENKTAFNATSGKITTDTERVRREIEQVEAYTRPWDKTLADSAQIARIFRAIAERAKQSGVQTTRFVPEPTVKLASLVKVPLRLGYRGSLAAIIDTLAGLEGLENCIWIDDLTIEPAGKDGKLVQCELILVVFVNDSEKSG